MASKLTTLREAIFRIPDNARIGIGGNVLHRPPMALIREIAKQRKKGLRLVKTAGAMDIDLLCLADCVSSVDAGYVGYESEFGLAAHYKKAVESGRVKANEHACYTVISALRAAVYGIPFIPVKGLGNSELIEANDYFCLMKDPFSGETVVAVKSVIPDFVLIHCEEADENGNFVLREPCFEDLLLARAAKKLIVSAERVVHPVRFGSSVKADFPGFLVSAVVHAPHGAAPCSFPGLYSIDPAGIKAFKAVKDCETLLKSLERRDHERP